MKQKIKIKSEDNVFADDFVEIDVPKGTKILSNEPYVKDLYELYTKHCPLNGGEMLYQPVDNDVVDATVTSIGEEYIQFDIGAKQEAYSAIKKESSSIVKQLGIGTELKIKLSVDSDRNEVRASATDALDAAKIQDILESIGQPSAFQAQVKSLVPGGYIVDIDGIEVFMPGSLAGMNKLWDFETMLGKEIIVMPINFSQEKQTIVVSRRAYLETLLPGKVAEARKEVGKEYTGFVTGTTKFGIFAEFEDCMTGLLTLSELDDKTKQLFQSGSIKPGDSIIFMIKDIINDKKIMLTQVLDTSWDNIEEKYPPASKVVGKIIRMAAYGAFIEIEKGIVGMLHQSEYEKGTLEEGQDIEVNIQSIDSTNKRIVFKAV